MPGLDSMGLIFLIFCMILTSFGETKTHIYNFQKIQNDHSYGDNYQIFAAKKRKSVPCSESMYRIFSIISMKIIYNDATKTHISNFKKLLYGRH